MGSYSSNEDDYFMSEMYSSVQYQMERLDYFYMYENGSEVEEKITFIFDYNGVSIDVSAS